MMASKLFVTPIEQNLILSHLEIRKLIKKKVSMGCHETHVSWTY